MPDSFYTVKGNEVSKENIVAEFINNYHGNLTDFNEGSEIRNLLEAFAVYAMGLEERLNDTIYVMDIMNADGEYLDLLAGQPGIDMERIEGVEATGDVVFTVKNALLEELLIPAGTVVTSDTGIDFETQTDNVILPGELSTTCQVECVDVGTEGNIPANSILTKEDGYDAVDGFTVSNPEPFSGGLDYEEDDDFRNRIFETMSLPKFGSKPYYISMLMNEFPEAHDILFDTTSSQTYSAVVTPNTYAGSDAQAKLIMDVAAYLADDNNIALGHNFNVISPVDQTVTIAIKDTLNEWEILTGCCQIQLTEYTTDNINAVKQIVEAYFKGGGQNNGEDFKGLNLLEEWDHAILKDALLGNLPDIVVSVSDRYWGDHGFASGKNRYVRDYHV